MEPPAVDVGRPGEGTRREASGILQFAGVRYWTASLLPALAGTTLPFWLRPPGFSFRRFAAVEFFLATLLFHAGVSVLHARLEEPPTARRPGSGLVALGGGGILAACLLGLHLNRTAPGSIVLVFGVSMILTAALYVAPPVRLCRRVGREVLLSEALGMLPLLGAYLVQTGDLTRKVYLASLPLVVATGLWVWIDELITRPQDKRSGRGTMVLFFGPRFSGRLGTPALVGLLGATLIGAVGTRSLSPWALLGISALALAVTVALASWRAFDDPARLVAARRAASWAHLVTGAAIAVSPLIALFG